MKTSLCFRPIEGGYSHAFLSESGKTLLAGGPFGDIMLELEEGGARAARYTSASDGAAKLERSDLLVETAFVPAGDACGFDVTTRLSALAPLRIKAFGHAFTFPPGATRAPNAPLDYAWLPTLKSAPGDVAGDHVFRSPCLIVRHGGAQAALVPNLDTLGKGPLRAVMDLDLPGASGGKDLAPRLSYSLRDYTPHGHVFYSPTGAVVALRPGDDLIIGFTLLFEPEAGPLSFRSVLRFLWSRYGEKSLTSSIAPQVMRFEEYAKLSFESTFERYGLWRGFSLEGKEVGGLCARIVRPGLSEGSAGLPNDITPRIVANYLLTPTMAPRDKLSLARWNARGYHHHLWNAVFFNNIRTSFGIFYFAGRWGNADLEARARAMWRLALAAPVQEGIFPSVYAGDETRQRWVPGTKVWRYTDAYHTPDAAVTGWWMLAIERHLDGGGLFRGRCAALGDFFLRAQLPSGAIPTWVKIGRKGAPQPVPVLAESAASAAAGLFLASLFETTGEGKYRDGALRVADFIIDRVFPRQAWLDMEVFYSCSPKSMGWKDRSTGILPQGTLGMSWAAGLMASLYRTTHEPRYLEYGRAVLDVLLLFQQIWNAPFLSIDTRGGFGVMNMDAEWNDARQAVFAPMLMEWYGITGEAELFHRGVSALRSAFTLMYLEEHHAVAPGNIKPMEDVDRGGLAENYGHAGIDSKIQGYVMPDWGGGTAVSAAALAQILWGDLYVDAARGASFGVNGCRVIRSDIRPESISLDIERLSDSPLILTCTGAGAPRIGVSINGADRGTFDRAALEKGVAL